MTNENELEQFAGTLKDELVEASGYEKGFTVLREGDMVKIVSDGMLVVQGDTEYKLKSRAISYLAKYYPDYVPF